jgi:hypothetical protein
MWTISKRSPRSNGWRLHDACRSRSTHTIECENAALLSATRAQHETGYKYRVTGGVDRDGDELSVIVAIEADLLVVTIF